MPFTSVILGGEDSFGHNVLNAIWPQFATWYWATMCNMALCHNMLLGI